MITLRSAGPDEAWINTRYASIGFLQSDLSRDEVVIAELDGEPAGIGRLVPAGDQACELGGIYVFDDFRGRGLARLLVDELLDRAGSRTVYCIPFADIETIYEKAGFVRCTDSELPPKIKGKLEWCAHEIDRPVVLMIHRKGEDV